MSYDMPKQEEVLANLRKMLGHNLAFAHCVVIEQAIAEIELLTANLEQMTRQANAVVESLHILSTSNSPRHGKH